LSEPITTPDGVDDASSFTVTHPFHPLAGQQFPLLAQRLAWGEPRVFFLDPASGQVRSLPTAWTSLAPPDPFRVLAVGRAILRLTDVRALARLLHEVAATPAAAPPHVPSLPPVGTSSEEMP
jgi:hypothetical protein